MRKLSQIVSAAMQCIRRPNVWRLTKELDNQQWWSTEKLARLGQDRVISLLRHAYSNVPYYNNLFAERNIDPSLKQYQEKWQKIPILRKDALRDNYHQLASTTHHGTRARMNASGGSTGKPVSFLSDLLLYDIMESFINVTFSWAGWKPGEMRLHLWGGGNQSINQNIIGYYKTLLSGNLVLPVYTYDESTFSMWWEKIKNYRPTIIYAYPSVAAKFAQWLEMKGYTPEGIKGVFCSAEMFLDNDRTVIERVFNCKAYNQYGSREAPGVACECPYGNMHIFTNLNIVEFIDSHENDDLNDIIITPLFNYAQPLIRYAIGDKGKPLDGACPCGRGFPLMSIKMGRARDHLISLKGKAVYPGFFTRLMDGQEWVSRFQFCQRKADKIHLRIEKAEGISDDQSRVDNLRLRILPKIRSVMGYEVLLEIEIVDTIDKTTAGKYRYVINELDKL